MFKRLSDEERAAKKQAEQAELLAKYGLDFESRSDVDLMSHNAQELASSASAYSKALRPDTGVSVARMHSEVSTSQNLIIIRQNELLARQNEQIIDQNAAIISLLQNNTSD